MAKSDISAITEVVPQVSYDIIGRIIPGAIVIVSLIVAVTGPTRALGYLDKSVIHPDPALSGWAVLLFVIVAYILAAVLDGIWQIPAFIRCPRVWIDEPNLEAPSPSLKFDVVNQKLPKAGAWATKLFAETNQARVLIVGWSITVVINLYFLVTAFSSERLWLEVVLIVGIAGTLAVRNSIYSTRETSLANLWLLLESGQLPTAKENEEDETTDEERPK